eukprot:Skav203905  [mRNA]  locus=scaffold1649:319635:322671:- [translate_table: standard]
MLCGILATWLATGSVTGSRGAEFEVNRWLSEALGDDSNALEQFLQQHSDSFDEVVQFAVPTHETFSHAEIGTAPGLWHLAESLQRCGVRALPKEWLSEELQWQGLQREVSEYFSALADVRSDDASVICRHFRSATKFQSETDNDTDSSLGPRLLRCPRCGKAIGQAKDMQSKLQVLHRDLDPSGIRGTSGDIALFESSAACREELHPQTRFQEVQAEASAMLATIEDLDCTTCELQAFGSVADHLWSALALLHCAPHLDEAPALLEQRLQFAMEVLESNLWRGVGFPSLHEAVSKKIFQLRRSRRFKSFQIQSRLGESFLVLNNSFPLSPSEGSESLVEQEREILRGQPFDISMGYFRLAQRIEAREAAAQSLALAAFWLRQVPGTAAVQAAQLVAEAAYRSAQFLRPGLQMLVLQTCLEALQPFNGRPLRFHGHVLHRLQQLLAQVPVTLLPRVTLLQMRQIAPYVDRLHSSFVRLLQTVSLQAPVEALQVTSTELGGDCQAANGMAHLLSSGASCATPEAAQEVQEQHEQRGSSTPSGRGRGSSFNADLRQRGETENFEAWVLSTLHSRSEPSEERVVESTSLAHWDPQVQTLQRLKSTLQKLNAKHRIPSGPSGPSGLRKTCCGTWRPVENLENMKGHRLRIRQDASQPWREADLIDVLHAPRSDKVQKLCLIQEKGSRDNFQVYRDLSFWEAQVQDLPAGCQAESCSEADKLKWPECIAHGQTIRGVANAGVFVNLAPFGVTDGCFREDCTYTDHFSSGSPAICARTCASIRACRWWSFWTSRTGGTCWLRRHDQQRDTMLEAMTASRDCVPTFAPVAEVEPTLFQLAKDAALGPTQWDFAKILETFGHLTPSQVQLQSNSPLRRSALCAAQKLTKSFSADGAEDG